MSEANRANHANQFRIARRVVAGDLVLFAIRGRQGNSSRQTGHHASPLRWCAGACKHQFIFSWARQCVGLIAAVLAALALLGGCTRRTTRDLPMQDRPAVLVELDSSSVELGVLQHAKPLDHVFRIRNVSDRPVRLALGRPSCGCLEATLTPGSELSPGGEATVRLALMPSTDFEGRALGAQVVLTAKAMDNEKPQVDGHEEEHLLRVTGFVEGISTPSGQYVLRMSSVAQQAVEPLELIALVEHDAVPVVLLSVESSVKGVSASLDGMRRSEGLRGPGYRTKVFSIPVVLHGHPRTARGYWHVKYRLRGQVREVRVPLIVLASEE